MGKGLTEICSPQRKLMPDTVGSDQHKPTSLRRIAMFYKDLCYRIAEANISEEPGAGKLHAGICVGEAG